jgi:hypothetical protein
MNVPGRRGRGQVRHRWLVGLMALLLVPVGLVTARQAVNDQQSPATGHAQVTTQGISELPEGQVVWRVVERTAQPRGQAQPGKRVLSFILATEEPVLLTNVTANGKQEDVARLAPGESYMVKGGTTQIRASLTGHAVKYIAIELVPADQADNVNGATLLFKSAPFTAPGGERDIDLVRNVLVSGEQSTLPDTGQAVAILATEGSIDILPAGGKGKKLDAGEGAVFAPGDLEISSDTSSASTAGLRADLAAMTNSLQSGNGSQAAYVVAVIGAEIPPQPVQPQSTAIQPAATQPAAPQPAPTETSVEIAPTTQSIEPTATEEATPATLGSITATVYDCPPGMTIDNLDPSSCSLSNGRYDLTVSDAESALTLADAANQNGSWQWTGLPLGTYAFAESSLPEGIASYYVPGSAAVGGSPADGYTVKIDESAPDIAVQVFNFPPQPVKEGTLSVSIYLCPKDATPSDFSPSDCSAADGGFDITLSTGPQVFITMDQASVSGNTATWSSLPPNSYMITVDALPEGWTVLLWPSGQIHPVNYGETAQIGNGGPASAAFTLYAFQERVEVIQ